MKFSTLYFSVSFITLAKSGSKYGLGFLEWVTSNFTNDVSDDYSDYEEDFYKGNQAIKAFKKEPWETTDEIGQQASDIFDEKGPFYTAGYIVTVGATFGKCDI